MTWFFRTLWLVSWLEVGGAIAAVVLAVLRRWSPARTLARLVTLASGGIISLAVGLLAFGVVLPRAAASILRFSLLDADPGQRARILAEGISEMMNCSAMSVPAVILGGIVWLIARRRLQREPMRLA